MKRNADTVASSDGQTAIRGAGKPQCRNYKRTTTPIENDKLWVTPNYAPKVQEELSWFYMRTSYGRELKAFAFLQTKGIEVYCPQKVIEKEADDGKKITKQSVIPNSLFVHSTQKEISKYIGHFPLEYLHHYYSKSQGKKIPIIIPDKQMSQFRQWVEANSKDKFFREQPYIFSEGQTVKVKEGVFKGLIGKVVTIKGYKRVGLNIDHVGFIATSYIPRSYLENVSDDE